MYYFTEYQSKTIQKIKKSQNIEDFFLPIWIFVVFLQPQTEVP